MIHLAVHRLEDRLTPATTDLFASGAGAGSRPLVQMYRADGTIRSEFFAFDPLFRGGMNVAYADVNADGVKDVIAAAGGGGGSHVKVLDGKALENQFDPTLPHPAVIVPLTELYSFFAYGAGFSGGVSVAGGDVDADGYADIITGAGPGGGPHVKVFSGKTGGEIRSFYAFDSTFRGGVNVATGNVSREITASPTAPERTDIVVGSGPGMTATAIAFDGPTASPVFLLKPFGLFSGGVSVAVGDTNADGFDDIITGAGPGGGPHVVAYDGNSLTFLPNVSLPFGTTGFIFDATLFTRDSFFAFDSTFRGGVRVAASELTGDNRDDIITGAGPGGTPQLRAFNRLTNTAEFDVLKFGFTPGTAEYTSGVTVG